MRGTSLMKAAALLAMAAALVLPAQAAVGSPTATKSGVLVNYVSKGKLRISKEIAVVIVCSANCNFTAKTTIVQPGPNFDSNLSGSLPAGAQGGVSFRPLGGTLKDLRDKPGRYKIRSSITATNVTTGAAETISRTFRLKR